MQCTTPEPDSAHASDCPCCRLVSRRSWFRAALGLAAGAAGLAAAPAAVALGMSARRLRIFNVNTNEAFDGIYWANGRYIPPALATLNQILRDHRANESTAMDPELFDLLHAVALRVGSDDFYHVISAYRTPETNSWKVLKSRRVARNSQHMEGKAMDLRLPDISTDGIARIALSMHEGGVGLYRRDGFVHLDTGEPRTWGAALNPPRRGRSRQAAKGHARSGQVRARR
ncbi:MAG: DUF882 domain-containing protein [Acetobacteraceae bacterium]|nr:DUF882 domain-containing protein [Acetobacteraceae bacterium]